MQGAKWDDGINLQETHSDPEGRITTYCNACLTSLSHWQSQEFFKGMTGNHPDFPYGILDIIEMQPYA